MNTGYLRYRISTAAREVAYFPLDTVDFVTGNRPPGKKNFVGHGSWRGVGSGVQHHLSFQDIIIAAKE